jgi:hypothetical protein
MKSVNQASQLSNLERTLLFLPTLAGVVFGVLPFFMGGAFGKAVGYSGNDTFIYRLAGAATLGYGVAFILGLRRTDWAPVRLVVIATLTFNLASLYACAMEIVSGTSNLFSYVISGASILFVAITAWVLTRHPAGARSAPDVSVSSIRLLGLGVVLSGTFGLLPLLIPVLLAQLVGYKGTDVFIIRQAGAASLGYAVMAFFGIRSGAWKELRLPTVMALVFNGFSLIASILALLAGDPILIVVVIGAASLFVTVTSILSLQNNGNLMLAAPKMKS